MASTVQGVTTLPQLMEFLSSYKNDVLVEGLSAFDTQLQRLVNDEVDIEISDEADVLRGYLKQSPECSELFSIWKYQQENNVSELEAVIVRAITSIIVLTKRIEKWGIGTAVVRILLRNHMKPVYRNLSSGKHAVQHSALKLLLALASHGAGTTKELHEGFNFSLKVLPKLLTVRKPSDARSMEDVRSLYVRFILAFLVHGDVNVKKSCLEMKDFVSSVFKGMAEDSYELVEYILSVHKKHVVDDANLNRTVKIAFYNNYILEQITKLYTRTDPTIEGVQKLAGGCESNESLPVVADLAHLFLMHICTKPGVGICFQDHGYFPARSSSGNVSKKGVRLYNKTLYKYLSILRPTEDTRQQELVLSILGACPELVKFFWQEIISLSFEPRPSAKWMSSMSFAAKVIDLPVPDALGAVSEGAAPPPVSGIAENILPSALSRALLGRALQHTSHAVKHTMAIVMAVAFKKLAKVEKHIDKARWRHSAEAPVPVSVERGRERDTKSHRASDLTWETYRSLLLEEIKKRLPDVQIILALQHQSTGNASSRLDEPQVVESKEDQIEDDTTPEQLQAAALRLILCYQRYFPETIFESRFDYGKLFPANLLVLSAEIQEILLELAAVADGFKWQNRTVGASLSHLGNILDLHLRTGEDHIRTLTRIAARRFLGGTILFRQHISEIDIWVSTLVRLPTEYRDSVLKWLDEAFCTGVRNPFKTIDRMALLASKVPSEGDTLALQLSRWAGQSILSLEQHIDRFYKASAIPDEDADGPNFPFSIGVLCAIDALYALLNKDAVSRRAVMVSEYMHLVIKELLLSTQGSAVFVIEALSKLDGLVPDDTQLALDRPWTGIDYCIAHKIVADDLDHALTPNPDQMQTDLAVDGAAIQLRHNAHTAAGTPSEIATLSMREFAVSLASTLANEASPDNAQAVGWFLELKHPAARSFLDRYPDLVATLISSDMRSHWLGSAIRHLSPSTLLSNIVLSRDLSPTAMAALKSVMHDAFEEIHSPVALLRHLRTLLLAVRTHDIRSDLAVFVFESIRAILSRLHRESAARLDPEFQHPNAVYFHDEGLSDDYETAAWMAGFQSGLDMVLSHHIILQSFFDDTTLGIECARTVYESLLIAPKSLAGSFDRYLEQIVDVLLAHLSSQTQISADAILRVFELFRHHIRPHDLDKIIKALFESAVRDKEKIYSHSELLSLALTADGSTDRRISSCSFVLLLELIKLKQSPDLDILALGTLQRCYSRGVAVAQPGFAVYASDDDSVPCNAALLIDSQIVDYFARQADVGGQVLQLLATHSPAHRNYIIRNVVPKSLKGTAMSEMLLAGLLQGVCGPPESLAEKWQPEELSPYLDAIQALWNEVEERSLDTLFKSLTGQHAFHADEVAKVSIPIYVAHLTHPSWSGSFFADLLSKTRDTKAQDSASRLHWLPVLLPGLSRLEEPAARPAREAAGQILVPIIALRAYYHSKKKCAGGEDEELAARNLSRHLVRSLEAADQETVEVLLANDDKALEEIKSYIVSTLKYRVADLVALEALTSLIQVLYGAAKSTKLRSAPRLPFLPDVLCEMIISHSQFETINAPGALTSAEVAHHPQTKSPIRAIHPAKSALLGLLLVLVKLDPVRCCRPAFLKPLSAGYQATVHPADRTVLEIWSIYEAEAGVSVASHAVAWSRPNTVLNTVSPVTAAESILPIDPVWMAHTLQLLPVAEALEMRALDIQSKCKPSRLWPLYDIKFVLPLTATAVVTGESKLDLKRLIEVNCLGLAVVALSAEDTETREAGYFVVDKAYQLIESSPSKEHNQVMLLLESLKNAITDRDSPQRVPSIVALFVAQALMVVMKPENSLYPLINRFLLQRPTIDLEDVPMFYSLFYSHSSEFRKERIWMLRLLSCGLKTYADYRIYKRRHVFDIVTGFFHSSLADAQTRKLVFELIFKASFIPGVIADMANHSGLLAFFTTCSSTIAVASKNELSLALPRLLTQVVKGWDMRDTPGASLWTDSIAATVKATLDTVCLQFQAWGVLAQSATSAEELVWWCQMLFNASSLLAATLHLASSTDRHNSRLFEPATLLQLVRALQDARRLLSSATPDRSTATNQHQHDQMDPETLYSVDLDSSAILQAAFDQCFSALCLLETGSLEAIAAIPDTGALYGLMAWSVSVFQSRSEAWQPDHLESYLTWLLRLQIKFARAGARLPTIRSANRGVQEELEVQTTLVGLVRVLALAAATRGHEQALRTSALAAANLIALTQTHVSASLKRKHVEDDDPSDGPSDTGLQGRLMAILGKLAPLTASPSQLMAEATESHVRCGSHLVSESIAAVVGFMWMGGADPERNDSLFAMLDECISSSVVSV
ncbi:ribosome 60S biogenesis N-terminal-domain-containing protein [Polychytrium aggregatum]|uniref:ribosome 60S biogenesis N-terminal-domain-containing protein n=1 Tax=Polychytrium aggregatum TaxID=110093 RepID=UPI0022FE34B4|nr:ribosome 60S biogenesis N-terminal-domain-containing protein [Polychytrium aggregatum]KAI9205645.1 ribosome 60S biogenesis N-terminal-domain-containing protein [Polychytrium aggregatum]